MVINKLCKTRKNSFGAHFYIT